MYCISLNSVQKILVVLEVVDMCNLLLSVIKDMANTVQTCGSREVAANRNCREWLLLVFIVFTFTFGIGFVIVVWTTQFHNLDKVTKFLELICDLKKSICWDFNY